MGRTGADPPPRRLPRHLRNEDIPTQTFTPRTYQVELLDAALQQNTLVCVGGTSSRMFLSVMLLKELSHFLRPSVELGGKRSIFLVERDADIELYSQVIEHNTDLQVGQYADDVQLDTSQWQAEIDSHHILVMTPALFLGILTDKGLTLSQISVLIVDDCHCVTGDHPYAEIVKFLHKDEHESLPRILGLTSCFVSSKCQNPSELGQTIQTLENQYNAVAETSTLVFSERYGIRPKEYVIECDSYRDKTGLLEKLGNILEMTDIFLSDCNIGVDDKEGRDPLATPRLVVSECLNILCRLGPWCAAAIAQMFVTQLEKIDKHETIDIHKKFLRYAATQLRLVISVFEQNFSPDYDVEELLQYTTPKVKKLIEHLRKFKPDYDFMIISSEDMDGMLGDNESDMSDDSFDSLSDSDYEDKSSSPKVIHVAVKKDGSDREGKLPPLFTGTEEKFLCGIIFVDQRYMAFALNKFVEEVCSWDEKLCFIKCHHITGQAAKRSSGKKGSKAYKKQEDILRKFRLQELNLLFANDVLEEGVDVPKCNLIVKFDPPKDYRSYSHSKGRARARDSDYVILMDKDHRDDFTRELQTFKSIEEVLTGRWKENEQDNDVTSDSLEESLYSDILPPYIPCQDEGGPQVNLNTAVALVNRYCAKLPSDAFTHLTPNCSITQKQVKGQTLYTASLRLPINSPMKDLIMGIPMPSKQLAKKSVALKTCELLHKSGELDDQLMPVGKELFIKEEEDTAAWDMEDLSGEARPGTTKRKQYYFKQLGDSLVDSHPKTTENNLYILNMTLTTPISDDQNTRGRRVYAPEETCRSFGLLSNKYIPKIPVFPVYTRSGEVTASIDLLDSNACFTSDNLTRLQEFHRFVFNDVLRLEKDPMDFNPENANLGYLIIPLNRESVDQNYLVDWDFIDLVKKSRSLPKRNIYDSSREMFEFRKEEYEDAVVMPSYRNIDQPQHFYVAEIRSDLNPSSTFPSPELYKTFSQYYTTKYGLTVTNQEQPLLDVDHTSARLNLLTPRYMNQKGVALPTSSAETKKARRENLQQKQILVPELCEVHVIPASLWRKAVCLPTILYRMNYLLVAEEIRITISKGAHIGQVDLPEDFSFPPLDFGFSLQEDNKEKEDEEEEIENIQMVDKTGCEIQNNTSENQDSQNQQEESDSMRLSEDKFLCKELDTTEEQSAENTVGALGQTNQENTQETSVNSSQPCDKDCVEDTTLHICNSNRDISKQSGDKISGYACDSIQCNSETSNHSCDHPLLSVNDFTFHCTQTTSQLSENSQETANGKNSEIILPSGIETQNKNGYVNDLETDFVKLNIQEIRQSHNIEILSNSSGVSENVLSAEEINQKNLNKDADKPDENIVEGKNNAELSHVLKLNKNFDSCKVSDHRDIKDSGERFGEDSNVETCDKGEIVQNSSPEDVFENIEEFGEKKVKVPPQKLSEIPFPSPLLSLDEDIDLSTYVGPSPCAILQALTMSNANDFFSLERLETIGDSFLKYAITVYLYCTYPGIHEGKLSYLRSKQVSNCNLYRLGKRKRLAECMISTKFEPYENWLPPGFVINEDKRKGPVPKVLLAKSSEIIQNGETAVPTSEISSQPNKKLEENQATKMASSVFGVNHWTLDKISPSVKEETEVKAKAEEEIEQQILDIDMWQDTEESYLQDEEGARTHSLCSYSLQTLHSIPDKSIADCVESLIGCYLTSCGKKAALQFMSWLGLKVLPPKPPEEEIIPDKIQNQVRCGCYPCPPSPLLQTLPSACEELEHLLIGYDEFEKTIGYKFRDRAYLLQAFTHASYHYNTITDCYQRLEFLGDAILDYVITRHLYEDSCKYSPGVLTDLRSALVNNNIFAALAVKWDFHKYFKSISPPLFQVINKFVVRQKEREDEIDLEDEEDDDHNEEYVELEVPKALGDIFESVAGAIYLDSGLSLDVVWSVYYRIMKPQIDKYLKSIPKSPVRELLEMEPETAKFEKPERTLEGKIRVTVNVVSKGVYVGIGRNYRIAKSAAAKKALRCIKNLQSQGLI